MLLIGFTGYARVGKDFAFEIIRKHIQPDCARIAFADELKVEINQLRDFDDLPPIDFKKDIKEKEAIRPLLVAWGEYKRHLDQNYWIKKTMDKLKWYESSNCPLVVYTDVRYLNEADFIIDNGGYIVKVVASGVGPANATEEKSIEDIKAKYKSHERYRFLYNYKRNEAEYLESLKDLFESL